MSALGIAPGLAGVEDQLIQWMAAMIRPGAAMVAAPLFGARMVPVQVRLILALAIGMLAAPNVASALPPQGMASIAGLALVAGEVVAGAAIGFALQIGYAAALVAGELIANVMGLGFAAMTDPASGHAAPVIGTWLSTLATFLLLASNGHLMLIARVADSYAAWPPGGPPPGAGVMTALVGFGGHVFAAGVTIALPVAAALILIQLAMAVLTRAAPQLNLFAVGFPVTIMAGLALLAMALPVMAGAIQASIDAGLAAGAALGALD